MQPMLSQLRENLASRVSFSAAEIEGNLQLLYDGAQTLPLSRDDRIVVFSDLHLGNGGSRDDFLPNGNLLLAVLRDHYLKRGYTLVLNGDIEELQRFRIDAIRARWAALYGLFEEFRGRTGLHKIIGNHDEALAGRSPVGPDRDLRNALRLRFGEDTLFLFHGHQATIFFEKFNDLSGFFLRTFANALGIHNFPVNPESMKRFRTEHRVYSFASSRKIVAVIGHTHRPLFESLSKIDTIRFRLEQLCRDYMEVPAGTRAMLEVEIDEYKQELARLWEKDRQEGLRSSLYNAQICIPCLFNSGCAIGKRGVTAIEIADGGIDLVQWFDGTRRARHSPDSPGDPPQRLGGTDYYRRVLKQDRLEYIFSRIRLLA